MTDDPFEPEELALIERLQRAPQPLLTPRAFDGLRGRVLESVQPSPTSTLRLHRLRIGVVAASVMLVATAVIVVLVIGSRLQPDQVAFSGTLTPPDTAVPTWTSEPSTAEPVQVTTPPSSPSITEQPTSVTNLPSPSPTLAENTPIGSPVPTNSPDVLVVVEGPVRSINSNILAVYDFSIYVSAENPILRVIKVGDFIRVKGSLNLAGELNAVQVSNIIDQAAGNATVLLDGRVQAIQNNVVTINSIAVELALDDPKLKSIQVGTFLSITGNFEQRGTTTLLAAVSVVIINNADVENYLHCKNLKGMGMGMGMGMGDDGMGMGMGTDNCR